MEDVFLESEQILERILEVYDFMRGTPLYSRVEKFLHTVHTRQYWDRQTSMEYHQLMREVNEAVNAHLAIGEKAITMEKQWKATLGLAKTANMEPMRKEPFDVLLQKLVFTQWDTNHRDFNAWIRQSIAGLGRMLEDGTWRAGPIVLRGAFSFLIDAITTYGTPLHDEFQKELSRAFQHRAPIAACIACATPGSSVACGACKTAVYCNAQCQARNWPLHKYVCNGNE